MQTMQSEFAVGNRVNIDGCESLIGIITAVIWRHPEIVNYEVSWVHNGDSKSFVIEGWRCTHAS